MPILAIFLVLIIAVALIWVVQRFLQDPAKTIISIVIGILVIVYLFRAFGLTDVRV